MSEDARQLLSRAARTATRYFRARAADLDLSVIQGQALIELDERPAMTIGALSSALEKDQASTSILVDKLMSMGLIRRETDPADRRRARLFLTAEADPMVKYLEQARHDNNRLVTEALGLENSESLMRLLNQFIHVVEESEAASHT